MNYNSKATIHARVRNTKVIQQTRLCKWIIDPRSQHESIEDEDWTSESFKQYQRECDEIMWEKPEQNPYDVQLTSEFNYSNNGKTNRLQIQFIFRFKYQTLFIWLLERLKQGHEWVREFLYAARSHELDSIQSSRQN